MFRRQRIRAFRTVATITGAMIPQVVGFREIPVNDITGSVGRAATLGSDFLPKGWRTRGPARQRYERVETALRQGHVLPPIEVYRIGTEYFVLDGHHRVAAARKLGQLYVDAIVTDYLPADGDLEWAMAERYAFELRTRLQAIELSDPAHYRRLLSQIMEHCWTLGSVRGVSVELPDAAEDWRTHVYEPVLRLIEHAGLPRRLPRRTLADLYAYVSDHKWFESQRQRRDVGFAWAVVDFASSCPRESRWEDLGDSLGLVRAAMRVWRAIGSVVGPRGDEDPTSCCSAVVGLGDLA